MLIVKLMITDCHTFIYFGWFSAFLKFWEIEIEHRLLGLTSPALASTPEEKANPAASAYQKRADPDPRDALLLDELRRSVAVMPLDVAVVRRLISALRDLEAAGGGGIDFAPAQVFQSVLSSET